MSGGSRHRNAYSVPSYVTRMLGVEEDEDGGPLGRPPSDYPAYVEAVDRPTPYPSTFVRQTPTQMHRTGSGSGGSDREGPGSSHVRRMLQRRAGEPEDVTRMRERLAAMGSQSMPSVRPPQDQRTLSALAAGTGRPVAHNAPVLSPPGRGQYIPPSMLALAASSRPAPTQAPAPVRQPPPAAAPRAISHSDDDDDDDDSDDHDDESDDTDEGEEESPPPGHTEAEEDDSGDTMMQMMRLQGLVRSAGPEHSASLVRWLTHQRGPPSEIMRDFESLLRAGGGPPPHSVLHTPVPPMPARVPQASPAAPRRAASSLAREFDALAAQGGLLNPDGTPAAGLLDSQALRAGMGLGMTMARGMNGVYDESDSEDDAPVWDARGMDARELFQAMRDAASTRLAAAGGVVARMGEPRTVGPYVSGPPMRQPSRAILLMPMGAGSVEEHARALAESIAASFAASAGGDRGAAPEPPAPKPRRRVANVPEMPPLCDRPHENWHCGGCGHDSPSLSSSCPKCFCPRPPAPAPVPTGVELVPAPKPGDECVICFDGPKDTLLAPCGHVCCCIACANTLLGAEDKCPVCRAFIENAYKVFTV